MTLTLGLRVKTGRALCVALAGTQRAPQGVLREEVYLADRGDPDTVHPYHLALEGRESDAQTAAARARECGSAALASLLQRLEGSPSGVGVAVNNHTPPERITSPHMRAHSLEGWLYREICEALALDLGLEPDTRSQAELKPALERAARVISQLGAEFGAPWNADYKLAGVSAWLKLPP